MDNQNTAMTMFALAIIAEVGNATKYTNDYDTADAILQSIKSSLLKLDIGTLTPWEVVWGPAVFSFPLNLGGRFVDNTIYIVKNSLTNDYAIAIAGTDASSAADWLFEDLLVATTMPWTTITGADTNDGTKPNISLATYNGLSLLLHISPPAQAGADAIPGSGQTLLTFLGSITSGGPVNLYVTGHSLGGALSPALTLALADMTDRWDPKGNATLQPYAFAGPTPGDQGFMTHFKNKIPAGLQRIWNKLDAVPHAWDQKHLGELPGLYGNTIDAVSDAVKVISGLTKNIGYTTVNDTDAAFSGPQQNPNITTFADFQKEVPWQHTVAYAQYFGIPTDAAKSFKARKTGG